MSAVAAPAVPPVRRRRRSLTQRNAAGWAFIAPMVVLIGLFLVVPVLMALWVSFSNWTGRGSPLSAGVDFVGVKNYSDLLVGGGLATADLGTALRNNFYYVLFVVPLQTLLSLVLAFLVNRKMLRGKGFFRTAFYFPSVTSSVAITVLWLFLFSASGAINKVLSWLHWHGPNWFNDANGIVHLLLGTLGVTAPPTPLSGHGFLGISWWQWLAGPSVAMTAFILMAIFTTSGTFMLLFLAALQSISADVDEAAEVDGATAYQRFRLITVPMLRPTVFTVVTLGLIGCWQVFDQIYTGTQGGPAKTTLTPAFLSYSSAFKEQQWSRGAAVAFILFVIIVAFTLLQRVVLRERDTVPRRKRFYPNGLPPAAATAGPTPSGTTKGGAR
jgi:multiple sugar transport system permease protein